MHLQEFFSDSLKNWELNIRATMLPYDVGLTLNDEWNTYTIKIGYDLSEKIISVAKKSDNLLSIIFTSIFIISLKGEKNDNNTPVIEFCDLSYGNFYSKSIQFNLKRQDSFKTILNDIRKSILDNSTFNVDNLENPPFSDILVLQGETQKYPEEKKGNLRLSYIKTSGCLLFNVSYNAACYKRETIVSIFNNFNGLIENLLVHADKSIYNYLAVKLPIKEELSAGFDATYCEFPRGVSISTLFEDAVEAYPNYIALVFEEKTLTYFELNSRANQFAAFLRNVGVKREMIVGLMFEPSLEMIITVLAVLKAGGAYLPIDPLLPSERINKIITSSNTRLLISDRDHKDILENIYTDFKKKIYYIEEILDEVNILPENNLSIVNAENDLAYVIYTSGSTGNPKGVLIEHICVIRLLKNNRFRFDFNEQDCWTLFHNYSFDVSVWEIFGSLLSGGKLVIVPTNTKRDFTKYLCLLEKEKVTILNQTPSAFNNLLKIEDQKVEPSLSTRYVIFAGEKLMPKLLEKWRIRYPYCKLINMYGITEATVHATYKEITDLDIKLNSDLIGVPLPTLKLYVLDNYMKHVPACFYGELYISGIGISRGYLNDPELTSERFVVNAETNERMYKSGDWVIVNEKDELGYIGRIDNQVKVRGYRIELKEIDVCCLKFNDIISAFSRLIESDQYNRRIVTYIQAHSKIDIDELRHFLQGSLPSYMVPSHLVQIDEIPLTSNGKINYGLLYNPYVINNQSLENRNEVIDEQIAYLWSDLLNLDVDIIDVFSNFFHIGGDSLSAMIFSTEIERKYNVPFPISVLFNNPTLSQISSYITKQIDALGNTINDFIEIKKCEAKEVYKLSPIQRGIFFLSRLIPNSIGYNITSFFTLKSDKSFAALIEIFKQLIDRHEILRTSFIEIEGEPYQKVHYNIALQIDTYQELSTGEIDNIIALFTQPFDLSIPGLARVIIIKNAQDASYTIGIDIHHIITDYITNDILLKDFFALHNSENLKDLKLQYKDYAEYCNTEEYNNCIINQREYWVNKFQKINDTLLNLPYDYSHPNLPNYKGDGVVFEISKEQVRRYISMSSNNISFHGFFLSVFALLLHYLTNQIKIIIGIPYYGRKYAELLEIPGPFINTLPVFAEIDTELSFLQFNKEIQNEILHVLENADISFSELVSIVAPARSSALNPIFNVLFDYINLNNGMERGSEHSIYNINRSVIAAQFDLILYVTESKDKFNLELRYSTGLFKKEKIESWVDSYKKIVSKVTTKPFELIKLLDFLPHYERAFILNSSTGIKDERLLNGSIVDMFEHQVEDDPERTAVITNNNTYTYGHINFLSNIVANSLLSIGVKKGDLIAILLERSVDTIISILGILKSGAAYIPLDPQHPKLRLLNILEDSNVKVVVTKNRYAEKIIPSKYTVIDMDQIYEGLTDSCINISNPVVDRCSTDLIYVIYTSGTTGNPKGVMIEQKGILNRLNWMQKQYPLVDNDIILHKTPYTFDVSVWELLWWTITRSKVYILPNDMERDPAQIVSEIEKNNISIVHFVPSMLNLFLEYLHQNNAEINRINSLRSVFASGERLSIDTVDKFYKLLSVEQTKLYNLYGPTEACIDVTYFNCIPGSTSIPIGSPINNVNVYLYNKYGQLVGTGLEGEIYIGGKGLARGYLNNVELTSSKFVFDTKEKEFLYKTGDIGKWNTKGEIEYIGRNDYQVKIRGYRIELHEVEKVIKQYSDVKDTIVVACEDGNNETFLCAYILPLDGINIDVKNLRTYISTILPHYSTPAFIVVIDEFPLTKNNKIDINALKNPIGKLKPGNSLESEECNEIIDTNTQLLIDIWSNVLGHKNFSINDDFFLVGGDSLKMLRLIYKIEDIFNVKLRLSDVFDNSTISEIMQIIQQTNKESINIELKKEAEHNNFELSYAQKRIWAASMLNKLSSAYNIFQVVCIDGILDMQAFDCALKLLVSRHEMLRTLFFIEAGEIRQKVQQPSSITLSVEVEEVLHASDDIINSKIEEGSTAIFDLFDLPLFKIRLIRVSEKEHFLLFNMHHLVGDGWSLNIILRDFSELYRAYTENRDPILPEIDVQYKDFVAWQRKLPGTAVYEEHRKYWRSILQEEIHPVTLNVNYSNSPVPNYVGNAIELSFDDVTIHRIKALCESSRITFYMFAVSILNILLYKYTNQQDIVIGSFVAGREHTSLENVVGYFVNTILLRNKVNPEIGYLEFAKKVRENCLNALQHQQYPYEELVLKNGKDKSAFNRQFRIAVNMANFNIVKNIVETDVLRIYPKNVNFKISKFDLTLHISEHFTIQFEYNTEIYTEEIIKKFRQRFLYLVENICNAPNQNIFNIAVQDTGNIPSLIRFKK